MDKYCKEFTNTSAYIYNWYAAQETVKEESLTDWFLYNLSTRLSNFIYAAFSRIDENQVTGADFEFWIISNNQNFAARIQAKKLKKNGNHYESLAYPNRTNNQINKLLSSQTSFRKLYMFYNNNPDRSACKNSNNNSVSTLVVDANQILKLSSASKKIFRDDILKISIPLQCFFCCPIISRGRDVAVGLEELINNYFDANNSSLVGFNNKIPDYISDLIYGNLSRNDWVLKYRRRLANKINAICILDLRRS